MALVIDLKPNEKILIGETVITNDKQRTRIHIAGDAPILREKDIMKEEDATTPCKRVYFIIQCMYMARRPSIYHAQYFEMVEEIQNAAPSTSVFFMQINDQILNESYYKALKLAKDLTQYEEELLDHARHATG